MTTITKTVKKYGNSGGVYLPADWIGGTVQIRLAEEPLDPRKDLLSLPLEHIVSIILYGSYARGEMEKDSDIDLILVVDDPEIKVSSELRQKYDIQIKTVQQIKNTMNRDPIFHKSIKDSSMAIINRQFLDSLKSETNLDMSGIKIRIELAQSSLSIVKSFAENYEDLTDMAYSIIMHLKEMLIIDCLFSNRKYTTKLLMKEILKHISPSDAYDVMNAYRSIRDNKKYTVKISEEVISRLILLLEAKIKDVKQKAHKKRH